MADLQDQKCVPCEGGVEPLRRVDFEKYLGQLPQWRVVEERELEREYVFANFAEALRFVNEVGRLAEEEGHHPDILLHSWNKVQLRLSTHAIGGLSINDFVMAVKVDGLEVS
jgi:4a-hydroxytetrahydrobiopterin dehydratase